mgnify:CR=1 FL=1
MVTVKLREVTLRFDPGPLALREISLELRSGELVILAGANGAGKSALIRVSAALIEPSSGVVSYSFPGGKQDAATLRKTVRVVSQHPSRQILGATVREDLAISADVAGVEEALIPREADAHGLSALIDRPTHALSGGEQRRLALAGALMGDPRLLLFDEPFLELDYPSTREFLRTVLDARERGAGVVIATHDYHRVLAEADRMIIMAHGRVEADDPPESVLPKAARLGLRPPEAPLSELTWLKGER